MKDEVPSIAKTFIARRIAEFPTLYSHGDQVIFCHLVSNMGSCYWDKNGLLQHGDKHYNPTTKKFTKYPLRMPMETAYGLVASFGKRVHPYYDISGPINNMPANIEESWLEEISHFLYRWSKYSMDDFTMMATMHCMLHYGCKSNPAAGLPGRTINDYALFHKKIPSWQAMVTSIEYQKRFDKVDPKTYMGIDI
jgi:hypothetical protein